MLKREASFQIPNQVVDLVEEASDRHHSKTGRRRLVPFLFWLEFNNAYFLNISITVLCSENLSYEIQTPEPVVQHFVTVGYLW